MRDSNKPRAHVVCSIAQQYAFALQLCEIVPDRSVQNSASKKFPALGNVRTPSFFSARGELLSVPLHVANVFANCVRSRNAASAAINAARFTGKGGMARRTNAKRIFCGDHRTQSQRCKTCGLRKSPRDKEIRIAPDPWNGRKPGKFRIRFVKHHRGVWRGIQNLSQFTRRH